jgi:hypothetical protein
LYGVDSGFINFEIELNEMSDRFRIFKPEIKNRKRNQSKAQSLYASLNYFLLNCLLYKSITDIDLRFSQ